MRSTSSACGWPPFAPIPSSTGLAARSTCWPAWWLTRPGSWRGFRISPAGGAIVPLIRSTSRRCSPAPSRCSAPRPTRRASGSTQTFRPSLWSAGPRPSSPTCSAACSCTRRSRCRMAVRSMSGPARTAGASSSPSGTPARAWTRRTSRGCSTLSRASRESALGLSVAWGVMSRLGGSLQAQSRRGEGTTFTLTFPLAAPPRREPPRPVPVKPPTRRILIVDDEQDNLEVLREVLELENQDVDVARGGPEALALFGRGQRFDLVLCDVGMPEMSGWQVAREIQRIAPGTPVWMLTGWANEIGESDPRLDYVRGVLAKPLDLERLRSLLHASSGAAAARPDVSAVH